MKIWTFDFINEKSEEAIKNKYSTEHTDFGLIPLHVFTSIKEIYKKNTEEPWVVRKGRKNGIKGVRRAHSGFAIEAGLRRTNGNNGK